MCAIIEYETAFCIHHCFFNCKPKGLFKPQYNVVHIYWVINMIWKCLFAILTFLKLVWYILLQEPFYELFFPQNCIHLSEVTKRRSLISVRTHVLLYNKGFHHIHTIQNKQLALSHSIISSVSSIIYVSHFCFKTFARQCLFSKIKSLLNNSNSFLL